ncbi:ABC transporter substrate-binding protein [Catenulispora rubra]|uniref:ABC transporter substrate-binding protein n=1 Tax=Catenulispora rubra TaxID=280293 RepID=UPI0018922C61
MQLAVRRSAGLVALVAASATMMVMVTAVTGCGTRLPSSAFSPRPTPGNGSGSGNGSGGGSVQNPNQNPASDTGITPTQIRIGILASLTSPVGAAAFSGPSYGAQAFFRALNDSGGIHGRTVAATVCDDGGSGIGNQDCVHQLIDHDQVFALNATAALDYAGADYVSKKDVPDVGGQPITTVYDRYPHLYAIGGSSSPRDGRTVGWNGTLYQSTEIFRFFKQRLGSVRAAVVAYNQADSTRYASQLATGLHAEGYHVVSQTVDLALPDFQAVAAAMKADGTQLLFDAMDTRGNAALCNAMDAAGVNVLAKVTNVENWGESVRSDYRSSPACRNVLWATSSSRNYEDTQYPAVAQFRAAMARYFPDQASQLSAWDLEGWAAAQWLTDAIGSCGANVTRACVETFMNRPQPYDAHNLILPASFVPTPPPTGTTRACLNAARWQDSAQGGKGGWVTQVPDMDSNCFDVPQLPYTP